MPPIDWVTLNNIADTLGISLPAASNFKQISGPNLSKIKCKPPGNMAGTRRRTYYALDDVVAWLSATIARFDDIMAQDLKSRASTIVAAPQEVLR